MTHSDASPVLQSREHVLNAVALPIPNGVMRDDTLSVLARRDAGIDFSFFQCVTEPVGVVTAIRQQPSGFGQ